MKDKIALSYLPSPGKVEGVVDGQVQGQPQVVGQGGDHHGHQDQEDGQL